MALNSSGPISLAGTTAGQSIELENGGNGTTQISLNDTAVRALAGVTTPNSTIIMPTNFYGKSNRVTSSLTISANTTNYTLGTSKVTGYVAGKTDVTLTINSGVYVYSTSTGSYALTVDTTWTAGDTVTIVNNGTILGAGGVGGDGNGCCFQRSAGGSPGGPGLLVQRATSINNVNRISGGGGGGGGGGGALYNVGKVSYGNGGGGGGGGLGANGAAGGCGYSNDGVRRCTEYGGAPPQASSGSATSGGAGAVPPTGGTGGTGGSYGSSGASGGPAYGGSGPGSGGSGGAAISGNANITWIAVGTRNGSIT